MRKLLALAACGVLALGAAACGSNDDDDSGGSSGSSSSGGDLSGTIKIDGSSTVAPFAQAAQEAFQGENPGVKITCLLYTSPSPRDRTRSRMPSSA